MCISKIKLHVLLVAVNGLPTINPSEFRFCLNDETLVRPGGCVGLTREGTLYLQRRYTTLRTKLPPKEARDRFKALVVIQETFYDFELSTAFSKAISDDEAAMAAHYALPPTAPNPGAAGPS